jgi:hypothetical protein
MSVDFRPEYLDGDDDGWFFDSGEVPTMNLANGNAASVLGALNLVSPECALARDPFGTEELAGFADAEQVLGTALTYLAVEPEDAGLASHALNERGNFIDAGRRPGYLQENLQEIVRIATWARNHGRRVEWC